MYFDFSFTAEHIAGKHNQAADALAVALSCCTIFLSCSASNQGSNIHTTGSNGADYTATSRLAITPLERDVFRCLKNA